MLALPSLLVWIGNAVAAEAGCVEPIEPETFASRLNRVEQAFIGLNQEEFDAELAQAAADLVCLGAPLSPALAARYHRLIGLDQFVRRDEERARLAFAAARAVDPLGALPPRLLPAGHVARALSESASTPGALTELWLPQGSTLWIDGTVGLARPSDRDTILQLEVDGVLRTSQHLRPEDPLPRGVQRRATHRALLWAAGGAGLTIAGAGIGVAVALL